MLKTLTRERIAQGFTPEWTAEDRLIAVAILLGDMQDDIYAGRYSEPGRPNITSLQHLIFEPSDVLEAQNARGDLAPRLAAWLAKFPVEPDA